MLRVKVRSLEDMIARLHLGKQPEDNRTIGSNAHSPSRLGGLTVPSDSRQIAPGAAPHLEKSPQRAHQTERSLTAETDAANQSPDSTYQFVFYMDFSIPLDNQSVAVRQSFMCDWSRHLPLLDDVQFTRLEHDTLLDRYFKYSSCWLISIVPQLFLRDMLRALAHTTSPPRVDHYSPMLHCSLLAFAMALSDNPLIRQRSMRERFATKAKQLLHAGLGRPCLVLVQALAVLSEYHCGLGEREQGYMYLGMSIRAARAIGLGRVELRGPDQTHLATMSDWSFWSIYSQDKVMALDMDTDYDLRAADFNSELPCVDWEIGRCPWFDTTSSTGAFELDQLNRLTQVNSAIYHFSLLTINSYSHRSLSETIVDNQALNIYLRLQAWLNDLPAGLLISEHSMPFPHVIIVNLSYWWLVLRLHQPFYRPTATGDNPLGTVSRPFGNLSDTLCDDAVSKIVLLVGLYSRWHGLRFYPRQMIQVVFAAGSLLLKQQALAPESTAGQRADARGAVLECIVALRTIGQTWHYADMCASQLQTGLQGQQNSSMLSTGIPINSQVDAVMWNLDATVYAPGFPYGVQEQ